MVPVGQEAANRMAAAEALGQAPDRRAQAFAWPRRCDAIATRGHRQLIWTAAAGVALMLGWAALTTLDKVTRGSGRVVPQTRATR